MVSIYVHDANGKFVYDVRCKSTDTKPTTKVPNGSTCIEVDTGKGFLFDAEGVEWVEIPEGGSVVINPAKGVEF